MTTDIIIATADNAYNELYITSDMFLCASWFGGKHIGRAVDFLHADQPQILHYNYLADAIQDVIYVLDDLSESIQVFMTDIYLVDNYVQMRRAFYGVVAQALMLYCRNIDADNTSTYPRIIPAALDDLRFTDLNDLTVDIYKRILSVHPWQGWMERLRAQRLRTIKFLEQYERDELIDSLKITKAKLRNFTDKRAANHQKRIPDRTRKSINKSIKMFKRMGQQGILTQFLDSARTGQYVAITGVHYNYRLYLRPGTLINKTINYNGRTSPIATEVFDKDGHNLCELCVYFRDTPILDTLFAFEMTVKNSEAELNMLRAACVLNMPNTFFADPVLPYLKNSPDPNQTPNLISSLGLHIEHLPVGWKLVFKQLRQQAIRPVLTAFMDIMRVPAQYLRVTRRNVHFAGSHVLTVHDHVIKGEY